MVNGRFLHLVVLLVNPLTPWSIHDSPLKNTELFLHWPLLFNGILIVRGINLQTVAMPYQPLFPAET